MIRKYNYTGRKKIPLSFVEFQLMNVNDSVSFNATLKLNNLGFPDYAKVFVEAYFNANLIRFNYGTIGNIIQPLDRSLDALPNSNEVKFKVKVVDETEEVGKILGKADRIIPANSLNNGNKDSLLPVQFDNLHNQIWKVVIDDYGEPGPVLVFNEEKNMPGIREKIKKDPYFTGLIYPIAVRMILEKISMKDVDSDNWTGKWIQFTEEVLGVINRPKEDDDELKNRWIDDVVESFCIKFNFLNKINLHEKR